MLVYCIPFFFMRRVTYVGLLHSILFYEGPPNTWADCFPKGYSGSGTTKEDAKKVKTPKKTAKELFDERVQVLGLPNAKICEDNCIKP